MSKAPHPASPDMLRPGVAWQHIATLLALPLPTVLVGLLQRNLPRIFDLAFLAAQNGEMPRTWHGESHGRSVHRSSFGGVPFCASICRTNFMPSRTVPKTTCRPQRNSGMMQSATEFNIPYVGWTILNPSPIFCMNLAPALTKLIKEDQQLSPQPSRWGVVTVVMKNWLPLVSYCSEVFGRTHGISWEHDMMWHDTCFHHLGCGMLWVMGHNWGTTATLFVPQALHLNCGSFSQELGTLVTPKQTRKKWILQPSSTLQIFEISESLHLASIGHGEKTSTFMLQLEVLIGKLLPSAHRARGWGALCWDPLALRRKLRIVDSKIQTVENLGWSTDRLC